MSEPQTEAGKALLDWMAYIRDPAQYEPGDFYADDKPVIAKALAQARDAALAEAEAAVEGRMWWYSTRHGGQIVNRAAALAAIAALRRSGGAG